jgi:hypothetical protein
MGRPVRHIRGSRRGTWGRRSHLVRPWESEETLLPQELSWEAEILLLEMTAIGLTGDPK